ncbi:MAG TPA: cation:proton antiporter [Planctomycetota bacterium]|nr:cation:proton antiporter [Planctomycetota bacterium]HRR79229.1 cation:proton antiporter [Planctomycetota bacterium]HRT94272.1 cation:proton antiporter [Planctomycetota bacterium]
MHYLDETNLFLFLVQVILLLGLSRAAGILLSRVGQPAITGEVLVGVALGPTILGRVAPALRQAIFPDNPAQSGMLETLAWMGILFFLLQMGLETDFTAAWRQRREGALISLSDLVLPMLVAFVPCLLLPAAYVGDGGDRLLFALFVATIMTISALPVTARVMQDLNLYRSDTGLLILCALTINDVVGWIVFAVILGYATEGGMNLATVPFILAATVAFAVACLTLGRLATDRALAAFHRWGLPEPGTSLTFICLLGMLGGAITLQIGIHALFGFFIAGIMAGEAKALSEKTRHVIAQMVRAILVPLFFASIGLKVDFLAQFDLFLVVFILAIGVAGRFLGAWVGARLSGRPAGERHVIAVAHTPGGEMQIVVGILALEFHVISEAVFVAIVFGALASTLALGPWMKWALRGLRAEGVASFFARSALVPALRAASRDEAIRELCAVAARHLPEGDAEAIAAAALARENTMGTALGNGIAVPHARLATAPQPVVAVGLAPAGLEWNAPDGLPVRILFLVVTPTSEPVQQLRVLRTLAAAMGVAANREALLAAKDADAMWQVIRRLAAAPIATVGGNPAS